MGRLFVFGDKWRGSGSLCEKFPHSYRLCLSRNISILFSIALCSLNYEEVMQRKFLNFCLSPYWCVMCKRSAETSRRIFLPGSCDSILTENSFVLGRGAKAKSLCKCALAALFWINMGGKKCSYC